MAQTPNRLAAQDAPNPVASVFARVDHLITRLWRLLLHPGLLFAVLGAAWLIIVAGILLPQVPGEFRNEPVATSRWLVTTSNGYGQVGEILRTAGFYDVLHSPLLWFLLGFAALLILLQGFAALDSGLASRTLAHILASTAPSGEPLPLRTLSPLFRRRFAAPSAPQTCAATITAEAVPHFSAWREFTSPLAASTPINGNGDVAHALPTSAHQPPFAEARMLGLTAPTAYWLRPFIWLGLLVCLFATWLIINYGWQVVTPTLVPGDLYRVAPRELEVAYLAPVAGEPAPSLVIRHASDVFTETVAAGATLTLGDMRAHVTAAAPSLLVATKGDPALLTRPGALEPESSIGLVFPGEGREESVLLPTFSTGLRIVRMSAPEQGYLVEIYRSADIRPLRRLYVTEAISETLSLDGAPITLEFTPLDGLVVDLQRLPSPWLLWLAAALLGAGLLGYWRQPAFLVVQVAPWPENRSVVILQTDRRRQLDTILPDLAGAPVASSSDIPQTLNSTSLPRGV